MAALGSDSSPAAPGRRFAGLGAYKVGVGRKRAAVRPYKRLPSS